MQCQNHACISTSTTAERKALCQRQHKYLTHIAFFVQQKDTLCPTDRYTVPLYLNVIKKQNVVSSLCLPKLLGICGIFLVVFVCLFCSKGKTHLHLYSLQHSYLIIIKETCTTTEETTLRTKRCEIFISQLGRLEDVIFIVQKAGETRVLTKFREREQRNSQNKNQSDSTPSLL